MSLTGRLTELLRGKAAARRGTEQDVDHDEHQALRRPGEFVGRVAGEVSAEGDDR